MLSAWTGFRHCQFRIVGGSLVFGDRALGWGVHMRVLPGKIGNHGTCVRRMRGWSSPAVLVEAPPCLGAESRLARVVG